jgi:hypothetical protein
MYILSKLGGIFYLKQPIYSTIIFKKNLRSQILRKLATQKKKIHLLPNSKNGKKFFKKIQCPACVLDVAARATSKFNE